MKKLYYAVPFVIVPASMLLCELLDNAGFIKMNPHVMGAVLFLLSAIVGNLTSAARKFDYLMTVLMPLSLFVFMFIGGYLDETEVYARFDLRKAIKVAAQPGCFQMYIMMAVTTFLASFKPVRIIRKIMNLCIIR